MLRLRTRAELEACLAVWRAIVEAGAYADVAAVLAGELMQGLTPERAEELVSCLERLHDSTTTALVVVRAELRDELAAAQVQLPLPLAREVR